MSVIRMVKARHFYDSDIKEVEPSNVRTVNRIDELNPPNLRSSGKPGKENKKHQQVLRRTFVFVCRMIRSDDSGVINLMEWLKVKFPFTPDHLSAA